jgi:hypothetical protein
VDTFPNGYLELQGKNPNTTGRAATFCDPTDPNGTLSWNSKMWNSANFDNLCHKVGYPYPYNNTTKAYYMVPVLVSCGASWATWYPNPDQDSTDDVYSFRLRLD